MKINRIKYYSTNQNAPEVSFREALLKGLAPDGGLYMPSVIPQIDRDILLSFRSKKYHEIASDVLDCFLKDEIETNILHGLCRDAYNFAVPLEKVTTGNYILRLDQGPTASFKDFAARIMARLMNYYMSAAGERFTILTATSGDTGSAVANAFHGLENIDVIILFPHNEVSAMQRRQMTTLKGNIRVIAIDGKFDDCQQMVKKAFLDPALANLQLSSANSINIGRLLPQTVYYFYAWSRVAAKGNEMVVFSVPSGNLGNLMGGILAREMGLPVSRFIIATNGNNEVPEYLKTGIYKVIAPSFDCISNAMNVGHPSNLARIVALYGGMMNEKGIILKHPDLERMRKDFFSLSISDEVTRKTISDSYKKHKAILEPHGAVAWKCMESYREQTGSEAQAGQLFISLETAHPAKFGDEICRLLGFSPPLPSSFESISEIPEEFIEFKNDYIELRDYILKH
ncbi:MAG: threonine synthase [Bacteroidales bacterium]|jgi:threonine synthase|nr:threonine synthase [Bacteroidales bacterium]